MTTAEMNGALTPLKGPAKIKDKLLRRHLIGMGVKEARLPAQLRDTTIKRSRKGPLGAIVVKSMSGIVPNPAHTIVKKFERNIAGGREDIVEKLEAVRPSLNKEQLILLDLLRKPSKKTLSHLMADAQVEPMGVMNAYMRGCVELQKMEALIAAHKELPAVVKDLARHALDKEDVCGVCVGSGMVKGRQNALKETRKCPLCDGSGKKYTTSDHKEFATTKLLEITKMTTKEGPAISVTQNVGVKVNGGVQRGFMERMLETSDKILYPERPPDVVEAEMVSEG